MVSRVSRLFAELDRGSDRDAARIDADSLADVSDCDTESPTHQRARGDASGIYSSPMRSILHLFNVKKLSYRGDGANDSLKRRLESRRVARTCVIAIFPKILHKATPFSRGTYPHRRMKHHPEGCIKHQ